MPVGNIRYKGWKNFTVQIPNSIPQSVQYLPSLKVFSLVIWTSPTEKVTGAYVYIDQIKYLIDVFSELYDGYQLGKPDYIKTIWDKGASAPNLSDVKP